MFSRGGPNSRSSGDKADQRTPRASRGTETAYRLPTCSESQEGPDSLARMAQSQVTTAARVRSLIWGGPLRGLSRFICVHRRPSFSTSIFDRIDLIELIYMTITSSVFAILLLASGARPESLAGLWD